jgi:hypothetical protein
VRTECAYVRGECHSAIVACVAVQIAEDNPAMMLQGMGGAVIGVWAAHGEGQALFPSDEVRNQVLERGLGPIRCVGLSRGESPEDAGFLAQ